MILGVRILIGTGGQGVLSDYGISCHSPVGCSAPQPSVGTRYRPKIILRNNTE
jgi:hypothetical protein